MRRRGKGGGVGLQRQSLTILAEKSFQFVTICCSGLCKLAAIVVVVTLKTFSLRLHFHSAPLPPSFTWYLVYSSFAVRQLRRPVLCSICQKQCYKWPLMCSQLMCQAGLSCTHSGSDWLISGKLRNYAKVFGPSQSGKQEERREGRWVGRWYSH